MKFKKDDTCSAICTGHELLNDYEINYNNLHMCACSGLCFEECNEIQVRGYRVMNMKNNIIISLVKLCDI